VLGSIIHGISGIYVKCFRAQVSMFAAGESECIVELGDCWIYMIVWGCECECECQHLFVSHDIQ
jgi:hypothetical protein